jgi:predicted transposase YdaD
VAVKYRVVRLWELDPEPILSLESPALCPFVPLMRGNAAELVLRSQARIVGAPDAEIPFEDKKVLLTILSGLAGCVIKDKSLLRNLFSEIRLMSDNAFFDMIREEGEAIGLVRGRQEGRQEGREEGLQEGVEQGRRDEAIRAILRILARRFGGLPLSLAERLRSISDLATLESFVEEAAVCNNLDAFKP